MLARYARQVLPDTQKVDAPLLSTVLLNVGTVRARPVRFTLTRVPASPTHLSNTDNTGTRGHPIILVGGTHTRARSTVSTTHPDDRHLR